MATADSLLPVSIRDGSGLRRGFGHSYVHMWPVPIAIQSRDTLKGYPLFSSKKSYRLLYQPEDRVKSSICL